jgi:aspartate aminotransferase-like enzyme
LAAFFSAALSLLGCMHALSPAQKMQDAANDLTTAVRFSRIDAALERVSIEGREDFIRKHAAWGSAIRVADCELAGLRMVDQENATVTLTVSWQRIDESDLRGTQITQRWKSHTGKWLLESEERLAGDVGLLGESTTVVRSAPTRTQFESITIR